MSEVLANGFRIKTQFGGSVKVEKYLAEGGQGAVYVVDYNGEKKALKWYKKTALGKDPNAFYANIKNNVMRGAPSKEFLWPLDITEWVDGTFGYIMDLRPQGYYEVTDFMLRKVRFKSFRTIVDAALKIVSAYRILHNNGYSYLDLNDGNFFINPTTGQVLICDNDNVAPEGTETGIIGKPRYMAPEIVLGKNKPNSLSDRFSMSVILYLLFCLNHPLEGKRYLVPGFTPAHQEKLYGSDPLFMMDPDNQDNGPHPKVHSNSIIMWRCLPEYMRGIFISAFSKKALERPAARPKELDWLKVLSRFRSEIVACSCGNEIFVEDGKPCRCDSCRKMANIPYRLQLSEYSIPAVRDSRIYRCQLGVCDANDALKPVAQIVEKESHPGAYGIRNLSERRWDAVTTKGENRKVASGDTVPVIPGIVFNIEGEKITIEAN